ncbi:MAG TPA: hypothetical protein VFA07_16610 [Chthonomonadaceae bacterium]|nr:hypothetical protein [Chthonomonadaceae bacterium]
MKKELNPTAAVVIVIVVLLIIGGLFYYGQRASRGNPEDTNLVGADGKIHLPHPAGGGSSKKQ